MATKRTFKRLTTDIGEGEIDIEDLDRPMVRLVRDTEYSLSRQRHFSPELKSMAADVLQLFVSTHKSMRLLIGQREALPLLASDALSLCREQIEKLYVLALVAQDPQKWITQYLRNDWKATYERHLLQVEEFGELPRFQDYLGVIKPEGLEIKRHWPSRETKRGYEVVVSDRAKRAVKFNFYHPAAKSAAWPKYMSKDRFEKYFSFPTPGKSIRLIDDERIRKLLVRWYEEYKFYSSFTHAMANKIMLQRGSRYKNMYIAANVEEVRSKLVMESLYVSCVSTATACSIIGSLLKTDYGVIVALRDFWELLSSISLFGSVIWEFHAQELIG